MTLPRVRIYHDPNTSESVGEWDTFTEAFAFGDPTCEHSVLMSNGETLATAYDCTGGGRWGWTATPEGLARARAEYHRPTTTNHDQEWSDLRYHTRHRGD